MNPAQIAQLASNLRSIGAFLDDGFVGTLRVKLAVENLGRSDVNFTITYPDWKNIGFKAIGTATGE